MDNNQHGLLTDNYKSGEKAGEDNFNTMTKEAEQFKNLGKELSLGKTDLRKKPQMKFLAASGKDIVSTPY